MSRHRQSRNGSGRGSTSCAPNSPTSAAATSPRRTNTDRRPRLDPSEGGWLLELARVSLLLLDVDGARAALEESLAATRSSRIALGRSLKPSQHPIGQIVDDFALERPLLLRLREIRSMPRRGQIERLKAVVRECPESTAAALMLLLALRENDLLGKMPGGADAARSGLRHALRRGPLFRKKNRKAAPERSEAQIPKHVVQYHDAPQPPSDIEALMNTWRDETAGFAYTAYDAENAEEYLFARTSQDVVAAFRRASHATPRADIFRLAYLANEGGIYADPWTRRIAPLDAFTPAAIGFLGFQDNFGAIGTSFVAAAPNHPVVRRALQRAVTAINRGDNDIQWLSSGPGLMARAFAEACADRSAGEWLAHAAVVEAYEMPQLAELRPPQIARASEATTRRTSRRKAF